VELGNDLPGADDAVGGAERVPLLRDVAHLLTLFAATPPHLDGSGGGQAVLGEQNPPTVPPPGEAGQPPDPVGEQGEHDHARDRQVEPSQVHHPELTSDNASED